MENIPLSSGGKPSDQPLKIPFRVANNPHQTIFTKYLPAATDNLLEATNPSAGDCSPLEDVAANQPICHYTERAENFDHRQTSNENLASGKEVIRNDVLVVQTDHIRGEMTMGTFEERFKSTSPDLNQQNFTILKRPTPTQSSSPSARQNAIKINARQKERIAANDVLNNIKGLEVKQLLCPLPQKLR